MREKPVRVLLSEGSSLSSRQAIWALGLKGHIIDVCDPNPVCLGRFSRFVTKLHRSPRSGDKPLAYLNFVLGLLRRERCDVLLPIHEQILLFTRVRDQLPAHIGIALPTFDSLLTFMSKSSFIRLLKRLNLPHPHTRIIQRRREFDELRQFPYYVKTAFGTASSGVWRVENTHDYERVIATLEVEGILDGTNDILVQDLAPGVLEAAQAIFDHGRLVAFHCYRMTARGQRGGMAAKLSVHRPFVRQHVEMLGSHLRWHGSVTFDYFFDPHTGQPAYVDANPRLVEPMNAVFSGVNLADLLVQLSLREHIEFQEGRPDTRSHMLLQSLLGIADRGESRGHLLRELAWATLHKGIYERSREELTPVLSDLLSLLPVAAVAVQLLINPRRAEELGNRTVADYALTPFAIRTICQM